MVNANYIIVYNQESVLKTCFFCPFFWHWCGTEPKVSERNGLLLCKYLFTVRMAADDTVFETCFCLPAAGVTASLVTPSALLYF